MRYLYILVIIFGVISCDNDNSSPDSLLDPATDDFSYEFKKYYFKHEVTNTDIPYHIFKPKPPYNSGEKFPLILALHGMEYASINEDLFLTFDQIDAFAKGWIKEERQKDYPAYVLAPNIYKDLSMLDSEYSDVWTGDSCSDLIEKLLDFIIKENPNIDTNRIYLTGHSAGGIGTWFLGAKMHDRFAALVPLSSAFYTKGENFTYLSSQIDAHIFEDLPVWSFIHRKDANLNATTSGDANHGCRGMFNAFIQKGYTPAFTHRFLDVEYYLTQAQIKEAIDTNKKHLYTEYEHECSPYCHFAMNTALEEPLLFRWLFKQKKN